MNSALERLDAIPRLKLGNYPTPFEPMPRLRATLGGGPPLWIKRDDYSGPGFGGNKTRKLDYILAAALEEGAEIVVTTGGETSNHARVTAAVAAKLGLRCILVLNRNAQPGIRPASLYLDELYGAEIVRVNSRRERATALHNIAEELRREGRRVAEIPLGASTPLGAIGYARAVEELRQQCDQAGVRPHWIFHSTSSGGTQAGLAVGLRLYGLDQVRLVGVSADEPAASLAAVVGEIVAGVERILGVPPAALARPTRIEDGFVGGGYGVPTPEAEDALSILARTEGIVLDPTYTAKAMAAMLASIRSGQVGGDEPAVFWHTGGQMALFAAHPPR